MREWQMWIGASTLAGTLLECRPSQTPHEGNEKTRDTATDTASRASAESNTPLCKELDQDGDTIPDLFDPCPDEPGPLTIQDQGLSGCKRKALFIPWDDVRYWTFSLRLCPDLDALPDSTRGALAHFGTKTPGREAPLGILSWVVPAVDRGRALAEARQRAEVVRAEVLKGEGPHVAPSIYLIDVEVPALEPRRIHRVDLVRGVGASRFDSVTFVPGSARQAMQEVHGETWRGQEVLPYVPQVSESSRECAGNNECEFQLVVPPGETLCGCQVPVARHIDDAPVALDVDPGPNEDAWIDVYPLAERPCGSCPPYLAGPWKAECVQSRCTLVK